MSDKKDDWYDLRLYVNYKKLRKEIILKLKKNPIDEKLILKVHNLLRKEEVE